MGDWLWLPILIIAYLLGSIPFGLLIGKAKGIDVRKAGSGNIGATNVGRIAGTPWFIAVLLLDAAKAAFPVLLMRWLGFDSPLLQLAAGLCAVFGHTWSVYLRGKGGRGVASALGVLIALTPTIALIGFASWGLVVALTRYISLASMLAGAVIVTCMFLFRMPAPYQWGAVALFVLVVYRHIPNIKRLLAGTEHRLGDKPSARQ